MSEERHVAFTDTAGRTAEALRALNQPAPANTSSADLPGEKMVLNMGPSHPATHGVLRIVLELDGEIITKAMPDVGFLDRKSVVLGKSVVVGGGPLI